MRPGVRFSIVNRAKTSFDEMTFAKLYLPILGKTAFSLYSLLRANTEGKLSDLLEVLNIGQLPLERAFDKLMGMSLLKVYEVESTFEFELRSPLNFENFFADELFVELLVSKIGREKVEKMRPAVATGVDVTKKFSDIFEIDSDFVRQEKKATSNKVDLSTFKKLMEDKGFSFADENRDLLQLYSMAEKFSLDWYTLFKLAEETANADQTINTYAMIRKQTANSAPIPKVPDVYAELVSIAKAESPQVFLSQLKRQIGGDVLQSELKFLDNLKKKKTKDEVQNILIHYILVQKGNSNLSSDYASRILSDWNRNKVYTAEAAIHQITSFDERPKRKSSAKKTVKAEPSWSNPDYKDLATDDEVEAFKKELEAMRGQK